MPPWSRAQVSAAVSSAIPVLTACRQLLPGHVFAIGGRRCRPARLRGFHSPEAHQVHVKNVSDRPTMLGGEAAVVLRLLSLLCSVGSSLRGDGRAACTDKP